MSPPTRCAACGAAALHPHLRVATDREDETMVPTTQRFGAALGDIARCARCGHGQVEPMPDPKLLSGAYAEAASDDYIEEEVGQRATARRTLATLESFHPAPGALLDVGCWVGFLLAEARDRGWQTLGLEPSEFASRYARQTLGLEVIGGEILSTPLPAATFDVVTMGDLIEHLAQPGEALDRIHSALRPDGLVWLALPDAGSRVARVLGSRWWSVIPTHVQYFTRHSIQVLLRRHGFVPVDVSTAPKAFTVSYYLNRIAGYSPMAGRLLVGAASVAGVADRLWAPDFRDRIGVVARRA
jgi:SAM-dependent methyltransferase